ncbi:TlpA disulfide reductase family protein [Aureispira anguillae]|uniref:AhpC/TSA family protein n=1 Tax=Aureispira anguillae TaxID=2864201 RepID=A0A915YLY1_9BACT|nr:TlpA disulfide reductase family protein [Aureispira anguillae]BDS15454.1 AhpC/TSA family protein [Aureispira anguillae]
MKKYYILFLVSSILISCSDTTTNSTTTDTNTGDKTTTASASPVASNTVKKIEGTPTTIKGTITGLKEGQKIFFDKKTLDATDVVGTTLLDATGNFELKTGIKTPGIYRVRLGAKPVYMLLKGGENIDITATMDGYKIQDYSLTGSLHAEEMKTWNADLDAKKIKSYLEETAEEKPLLHLYLVEKLDLVANIKVYKKVLESLKAAYPNDLYTKQFNSKVLSMEAKLKAQPVAVGAEAPEINLPNPEGKKIALSSLRGKVVLLDFWASWCRPCRMANPHVVQLYSKYNKKGFDVFNVSLDGIDDKRAAMYQNNPETIAKATEIEKGKWKQAIKTDKLKWKNHVSELRSWSSPVAALYGVNSIPKTFLIDKKGIIRYENLRGQALEDAIKNLLAEK